MQTDQIYGLVNEIFSQATGNTAIQAVDGSTLVAMGDTVLSSSAYTEAFLNTLVLRIGRTIMDYREYRAKFRDMVLNDFEYGKILQKIKVKMPEALEDPSYSLVDGQSIDPWTVYKPEAIQKLFTKRTPYMFAQTITRQNLKEAFLSAGAMDAFISAVMGEMRNAMEASLDNLARVTIGHYIATASGSTNRVINLVTEYNAASGQSLTAANALLNHDFLAYAIRRINEVFDTMQELTVMFNDGSVERFTPREDMRVKMLSPFVRAAETVVQYAAFHEDLVRVDNTFQKVAFWQDPQTPGQIISGETGSATTVSNIIAIVHDRDALGIYQIEEEANTTGLNPKGRYYTTYLHAEQLWFADESENFVYFTLN